ncbi:MAG: RIP metalloprotease RseP [Bacteroidota bacterium]
MQLNSVLLISGGAVQALQLIAALSILILLHEFGHFFFARLFKTRVEKFYLFFDFLFPFSGLLNFSLFKKKKGDCEYGIGWFPLGGYVKIAGMVDESMDKEAMALPPQPWEYRSKKPYQRLFIMLGGIIMNVLVAMVVYAVIFGIWGEDYMPTQSAKYGIMVDSLGQSMGLRNGDMIIGVDGKAVERFNKIPLEIIFSEKPVIQVNRNGQNIDITVPDGSIRKILKSQRGGFMMPRVPAVIGDVASHSIADNMGMKKDDSIIAMNGQPVRFYDQFDSAKKATFGMPLTITVVRNAQTVELKGMIPKDSTLGVHSEDPARYFDYKHINYGPIAAVGKGVTYTYAQFGFYWRQFKMIFTSKEVKTSETLGGVVSFGKLFSPVFDWHDFLSLLAFVSIILAFMNLLPIPGLDGGYVIFLLFEMITGRKVSDKVMEYATTVGLILLLTLMVYANGLDIFRLFKK